MLLLAAAVLGLRTETFNASDFFPLVPGTKLTYKQRAKGESISIDVVQQPVVIGDVTATGVFTYRDGQLITKTYYTVSKDAVEIVAYDAKKPLNNPIPLYKFNGKVTSWKFDETPASGKELYSHVYTEGTATLKGEQEVLKQRVPILEIKVNAIIGGDNGSAEIITQTSRFGKGIGLISTSSDFKVGRIKDHVDLKLLQVEQTKEK